MMKLVKENQTGEILGELCSVEDLPVGKRMMFEPFVKNYGFVIFKDKLLKTYNLRSLTEIQIVEAEVQ